MPNPRMNPSAQIKRQLMEALQARVAHMRTTRNLSQTETAHLLGITQPRLSSLVTGHAHLFSIESLADLSARAGLSVKVSIARRYKN